MQCHPRRRRHIILAARDLPLPPRPPPHPNYPERITCHYTRSLRGRPSPHQSSPRSRTLAMILRGKTTIIPTPLTGQFTIKPERNPPFYQPKERDTYHRTSPQRWKVTVIPVLADGKSPSYRSPEMESHRHTGPRRWKVTVLSLIHI